MPYLFSLMVLAGLMWPLHYTEVAWTPTVIAGAATVEVTSRLPEVPYKYSIPVRRDFREEPIVDAQSAIVVDNASGTVLWQKNPDAVRPIASLTKVITALTFLDYHVPWDAYRALTPEENALEGAKLRERPGERMVVRDLFLAVLVGSTNNGALSLAHATGDSDAHFAEKMTNLVRRYGGKETVFVEPTGLSERNVSTVAELWPIFRLARHSSDIVRGLSQTEHLFETVDNHYPHRIRSTNRLFGRDIDIVFSKTGYTDEAGYCLGSVVRTKDGHELTIIVLGASSIAARTDDTENLAIWAQNAYNWGL